VIPYCLTPRITRCRVSKTPLNYQYLCWRIIFEKPSLGSRVQAVVSWLSIPQKFLSRLDHQINTTRVTQTPSAIVLPQSNRSNQFDRQIDDTTWRCYRYINRICAPFDPNYKDQLIAITQMLLPLFCICQILTID